MLELIDARGLRVGMPHELRNDSGSLIASRYVVIPCNLFVQIRLLLANGDATSHIVTGFVPNRCYLDLTDLGIAEAHQHLRQGKQGSPSSERRRHDELKRPNASNLH